MWADFSKYNEEELLNHIDEVSKKLLTANPNYPAYRQLQGYLDDARFEYGERIQISIHQKEIDEGPQIIEIGQGEMEVGPEPVPEEVKEDLKKTAMKKLLAQAYVYNNKK